MDKQTDNVVRLPGKRGPDKQPRKRKKVTRKYTGTTMQKIDRDIAIAQGKGIVPASMTDTRQAVDIRLDNLQNEIDECLSLLTDKQRQFVKHVSTGLSHRQAALKAGYCRQYASNTNTLLLSKRAINQAISALGRQYQLRHGISLDRKRSILMHIADVTTDQNSDNFQPSSGVAALRLVAELDRDIKVAGAGAGTVSIVVQSGIPQGITIDGNQG